MTTDREDEQPRRLHWVPLSVSSTRDDADTPGHGERSRHPLHVGLDRRHPLWDAEGLLPEEPEWLRTELSLSDELIDALVTWGRDMTSVPVAPDEEPTPAAKRMYRELDS